MRLLNAQNLIHINYSNCKILSKTYVVNLQKCHKINSTLSKINVTMHNKDEIYKYFNTIVKIKLLLNFSIDNKEKTGNIISGRKMVSMKQHGCHLNL